jgi:uncharacterized membrane protein SpoIIM required for sporulation
MIGFVFLIHAGVLLLWLFERNIIVAVDPKILNVVLSVFVVGLCIGYFFGSWEEKFEEKKRTKTGGEGE